MPRKSPAGATFHADDPPCYFLATGRPTPHPRWLINVTALNDEICRYIETTPNVQVLLDSGIFSLVQRHMRDHGGTMVEALALAPDAIDGFDALLQTYCAAVDRLGPHLWGYIELDQGGAIHKQRIRADLEARGYHPIPVYHPLNDPWDYFDQLCTDYTRIAVGNLVDVSPLARTQVLATLTTRMRAYPPTWIHLLGVTPSPMLLAYPQASCDSSSWNSPLRAWIGWLKDSASLAPIGSLANGGRPAVLAVQSDPTFRAKLEALAAYVAHGLELNWRAIWAEQQCD